MQRADCSDHPHDGLAGIEPRTRMNSADAAAADAAVVAADHDVVGPRAQTL